MLHFVAFCPGSGNQKFRAGRNICEQVNQCIRRFSSYVASGEGGQKDLDE
jgi:hypothetical protein